MKKAIRITSAAMALVLSVATLGTIGSAQRTQSVGEQSKPGTTSDAQVMTATPPPAPATVKAKYEGGVVGYAKSDGTLSFDDTNRRLLFRNKEQKELFSVPYDVIVSAIADTQARRPTAANVAAGAIPYGLGLPMLLFKKKHRYLTLQYRDPDTKSEGVTSFKMENKDTLASVLYTLGQKAGLTQRGDAFIRRADNAPSQVDASGSTTTTTTTTTTTPPQKQPGDAPKAQPQPL
ncbi:MAG TPA: hypothetical protein VGB73_06230 [Pyrinomonadaceae bacterium]